MIRKQQEEELKSTGNGDRVSLSMVALFLATTNLTLNQSGDSQDDEPEPVTKTTRFAEGTNEEKKGVKKAVLARDHSLGREYLQVGEAVTLEGFSWQDPIETEERVTSQGSAPPPSHSYPSGRTGSHGSMGVSPPDYRLQSHGSIGGLSPPPPDYYGRLPSGEYLRTFSSGHFENWGPSPMSSFGSASMPPPPPSMPGYPHHGSWTQHDMSREHSLSGNHLRDASIGHPAPPTAFDSRGGSGYWGEPTMPPHGSHGPPLPPYGPHGPPPPPQRSVHGPPPPQHGSHVIPPPQHASHGPPPPQHGPTPPQHGSHGPPPPQHVSHGPPPPPPAHHSPHNHYSPRDGPPNYRSSHNAVRSYGHSPPPGSGYHGSNGMNPPSPPYDVDPVIAKTWSGGQEIKPSDSFESYGRPRYDPSSPTARPEYDESELPRPCMVKRATSNQNETFETKKDLVGPSVKRAALNRDNSLASNRLKEKYVPGYPRVKETFDPDKEMNLLSNNLEQSTLCSPIISQPKPKPLGPDERIS